MTAYPRVSTSFLQMRKKRSDLVKPVLLATAEGGGEIKLLWQRESRLLLSVTQITSWTEKAAEDNLVGIIHFGLERQKLSAMNSNLKCLWFFSFSQDSIL